MRNVMMEMYDITEKNLQVQELIGILKMLPPEKEIPVKTVINPTSYLPEMVLHFPLVAE